MPPHLRQMVDGDIDAAIVALTGADASGAANADLTDALFQSILVGLREDLASQRLTAQQYADELAALARQARAVGLLAA